MLQEQNAGVALYERLRWGARTRPDAPCVIEAETGASLTYRAFFAATCAMRRALGPEPRRIALALPGGITSAVIWASALTGGHALLPLAPDTPALEIARVFQRVEPDTLVMEREDAAAGFATPSMRVWTREKIAALIQASGDVADDLAPRPGEVILFTSGSTGEPKRVSLSAGQVAWTAEQVRLSHQLTPLDRGLTSLPFFHVNAPVVSLCASLMAGSSVVIAPRFSLSHFWEWVERYEVTWASLVPTILALLLQTERPAFLPGALRFVRTASAPLPTEHLLRFERRFGIPVIETYGLTEAASQICANPLPPARHKPGSVGLPVGVALRICAPRSGTGAGQLRDVPHGSMGEVCVKGHSVITSYDGGAGASAFEDGWLRTGDLGFQDAECYVYLTGRLRDVIIRGGENIAPREVEETLLAHTGIVEVAVIGCPDPLYGERVVAYIASREPWTDALETELRAFCATRLSPHKQPVEYVAVSALPRTPAGKVNRPQLRRMWTRRAGYDTPMSEEPGARAG